MTPDTLEEILPEVLIGAIECTISEDRGLKGLLHTDLATFDLNLFRKLKLFSMLDASTVQLVLRPDEDCFVAILISDDENSDICHDRPHFLQEEKNRIYSTIIFL
jgi:hypothetical protein